MSTAPPLPETSADDIPQPEYEGPRCDKCQAPAPQGMMDLCPCCGWYPSLGTFVAVDPDEAERIRNGGPVETPPQTFFEVWGGLIPKWGWILIGTQLAIVIASVVVRLALTTESAIETSMRAWWGSTQFIVGLLAAIVCHVSVFMLAAVNESDIGFFDMIVSPLKAWIKNVQELPRRLTVINIGLSSVVTALCAALIVGGIPWHVLLEWNIKPPPKREVAEDVFEQARKKKSGDENLDDLLNRAGSDADTAEKSTSTVGLPRYDQECMIVGYVPWGDDKVKRVLLAIEHEAELVYAGQVVPTISSDESVKLRQMLDVELIKRPIVRTRFDSATWVLPVYSCKVSYIKLTKQGRLTEMSWKEFLGETTFPWKMYVE